MANEKKTEYVVLERKVVQLIADEDHPDQYAEHEAFIPVRGLGSGKPPMPANSGPEACRLYARERGLDPGEAAEPLVLRACSVRNWSGTDAGLELQMTFKDVLPPPRGSTEPEREPEPPASEPEPAAA